MSKIKTDSITTLGRPGRNDNQPFEIFLEENGDERSFEVGLIIVACDADMFTAAGALRGSYNLTSLTDNGSGNSTLNVTNAAAVGAGANAGVGISARTIANCLCASGGDLWTSTSTIQFLTRDDTATNTDAEYDFAGLGVLA